MGEYVCILCMYDVHVAYVCVLHMYLYFLMLSSQCSHFLQTSKAVFKPFRKCSSCASILFYIVSSIPTNLYTSFQAVLDIPILVHTLPQSHVSVSLYFSSNTLTSTPSGRLLVTSTKAFISGSLLQRHPFISYTFHPVLASSSCSSSSFSSSCSFHLFLSVSFLLYLFLVIMSYLFCVPSSAPLSPPPPASSFHLLFPFSTFYPSQSHTLSCLAYSAFLLLLLFLLLLVNSHLVGEVGDRWG